MLDEVGDSSAVTMSAQQGQCDCKDVTRCVLLCTAISDYVEKRVNTGCREVWRGGVSGYGGGGRGMEGVGGVWRGRGRGWRITD